MTTQRLPLPMDGSAATPDVPSPAPTATRRIGPVTLTVAVVTAPRVPAALNAWYVNDTAPLKFRGARKVNDPGPLLLNANGVVTGVPVATSIGFEISLADRPARNWGAGVTVSS